MAEQTPLHTGPAPEDKFRDHPAKAPKYTDGLWDKPLVFDDKSLPSREDASRFNVAVAEETVEEARARAAAKEARLRAAYGGAPSIDDTTPPWVDRGEDAPEEWSPQPRPWWKKGLLAAAIFACSLGFVFALIKPALGSDDKSIPTPENPLASVQAQADAGAPTAPPPLMANPVADGPMKFQVIAVTPDVRTVVPDGGDPVNAEGSFLVVDMKAINADTQPLDFDPMAQEVITTTGNQYGPRPESQKFYSGSGLVAKLAPGQETQVRMAFDIPAGEAPVMLFVHSSKGSYGTTIKFTG